jgi:hypothetical protein
MPPHISPGDLFAYADTKKLAEAGMQEAVEHADRVIESWSDLAMQELSVFAQVNAEFMAEDLRVWAHDKGLPKPPDPRAWGAVVNRAVKRGIIVRDRFELTKVPPAHATPRPVWRSLIYRRNAA